jgi:hypothetical protein
MGPRWLLAPAFLLLVLPAVLAHADDLGLEQAISGQALTGILIAAGIVAVTTIVALRWKSAGEGAKWAMFLLISVPVLAATLYSAGSTIYVNRLSETKGPVHWHTDFEIWNCGTLVDLKDPVGFLNRIGTPTLHEHNENRIHIEGVLVHTSDASLAEFFRVIGGSLTLRSLAVPTNEGILTLAAGGRCPDGSEGVLQAFRHHVVEGRVVQEKLPFFLDYIPAPHSGVPPGDCLIIEFGPERDRTDHLCASYRAAISRGDVHGG